jgi:uncharacterized protein YyaL (SSP411 family)
VVVIGPAPPAGASAESSKSLADAMFRLSLPGAVQQIVAADRAPSTGPLAGKTAVGGKPTAYACLGPQCSLPVTEPDAFLELLRKQRVASLPPLGRGSG